MANGQAQSRSFSAQNENISGFAIWYPLLVCCFRLADIAGCRLSAMSDVERPKPELYHEAAERLRQLAGEIRLPDIRADLLDLSARFERMAAYYAAQIIPGAVSSSIAPPITLDIITFVPIDRLSTLLRLILGGADGWDLETQQ
jgi:hypothetical protein